jgi:hypothetical protein
MRLQACAIAIVLAALPLPSAAASLFDPALRFRTLPTEHFVIYFHQGEDALAQRLAVIAEETWRALQQPLAVAPPRRTHVVLVDQTDVANGYATPLPYNTIVLYTVWPAGADFNVEDWLRLVLTHEFTHIVHLDRSEGWARVVRSIFGRTPIAFPNLFLPAWQIEGLATYEESAITGTGRLHAGDFRAIVDEAARADAFEPLDRTNGGLTDWPGGAAVYAYGVGFHQYLADRFGPETLAALAESTARRLPYTAARAFRRVYGESLGALWREYEARVTERVAAAAPPSADTSSLTRLTHQGFSVRAPRFDRFPCAGCPIEVFYSASNPDGFPAMYRVGLDGAPPREVTTRFLGSTTAIGRDVVYFDQLEIRRNVGVYSDLYVMSRSDGRVRQITLEARLHDPDLSPDGETLVCVKNGRGQRDLVLVRLTPGGTTRVRLRPDTIYEAPNTTSEVLIAEPETQFDTPRWSPDGRTIVVERHRPGSLPEIVVVDLATKAVRIVAAAAGTRFVMPAWRPDGRAIVAAGAPEDETFNLFEFPLDGSASRQLTHTTGGATWPDVSPDGRTLAFVGYTSSGYDLFTMPYPIPQGPSFQGGQTDAGRGTADPVGVAPRPEAASAPIHGYSPWPTLKPTSWSPILETGSDQVRVGAEVGGFDVLGYHSYVAGATWLVSSPDGAPTPSAASPDWQGYYAYTRWRPTFFASTSSDTLFFAGPATDAGTPTASTRRERQLQGGVLFPIRHARVVHSALLSVVRAVDEDTLASGTSSRHRLPMRAAWQTITGRTYGYSISREHGLAAGATAEFVRRGLGSFADATTISGDARVYLPAFQPHHVVAVRVGGGASTGDPTVGRTFLLGGHEAATEVASFDTNAFSLLRGFGRNTFAGSRVAVANAEYRWPIARPQRGIGTWPVFLHSIHAAVFADAGHAWTRTFRAGAIKTSAGAQLSANIVAGYFAPFTATIGAAWGHDGSGLVSDRATAYFQIGRAF